MDSNLSLARAYLDMYEAKKVERESWIPEAIADEDVADFMGAAAAAAKAGKKEFKFGDKTYKVTMKKSTADKIDEAEEACPDCGKVHEGSCMKESTEELDENNSDKYMWKDINAALMKAGMNPPQIMKVLSGLKGKAIKEEALDEVTKDTDVLEPRAKGEKDFKKMHDDNVEINDEEKNDEENFKNIKKSADAIKK
jgi:hypothetical protein